MYAHLLAFHSILRWLVVIGLIFAIYRAYRGWLGNKSFSKQDGTIRTVTTTIVHVQLLIGLWLYFISPVTRYFMNNFKESVHMREYRFFGMEHIAMMLVGIIIITIASSKSKRKATDQAKFKTLAIGFTIGF